MTPEGREISHLTAPAKIAAKRRAASRLIALWRATTNLLRQRLNYCYFPHPSIMHTVSHKPSYTLARARVGERLRVVTICPDCPECLRLRELGFQDRVEVRKIADGAAIICSIMGMRVAIGRDLGEHVRVEKIAA